jgi:SAM-dependent methyltransferase
MSDRAATFERWREQGSGHSPLFSEPMLKLALAHLEPLLAPGRRVLDLGAGAGHMAALFRASGATALALDVDLTVLRDAGRTHPGPVRVAADQSVLPFRTASLDAVFSFSSLQYSDRAAALAECARVLRPGGRIAVVENLAGNPFVSFGRWLRAVSRTPYPQHLEPRRHLHWSERSLYVRHFADVRFHAFHVLTPLLLASGAMASAPVPRPGDKGMRAVRATLHRWDGALARRWPAAAWTLVACGTR